MTDLAYVCQRCERQLRFSDVFTMSNIHNGQFFLAHTCWCSPGRTFERTFRVDHPCIAKLLEGFRPVLPYQAADGEALPLRKYQERLVAIFRWECKELESVEEFLLLATRPHPPVETALP